MLRAILPAAAVVFLAAGLNVGVTALLGNVHVQNWGAQLFMKLFEAVGQGFFGTLLLVLSIHVLWFFGIHGSNMLEAVTQRIFENGLAVNQALEAWSSPSWWPDGNPATGVWPSWQPRRCCSISMN